MLRKIKEAIYYRSRRIYNRLHVKMKCAPYYKYMLDAESKRILRLRGNCTSYVGLINNFVKDDMKFAISELDDYQYIVVCLLDESTDAVEKMNYTKILLEHSKWRNSYRCIKWTDDIHILDGETVVPVWGTELNINILKQKLGENHLHIPVYSNVLVGAIGRQYFDVFEPYPEEVIVDCGACDGTTELQFAEWTRNTYKKIYAFEPNKANQHKCLQFYENNALRDIELIPKGTWSRNTTLSFSADQGEVDAGGGVIDGNGVSNVMVTTIDDVVGNDKVTFIKMDVEGAELESLKGAAETIKRNAPRLAICIYHKQEDLWTIPSYILKLNSNYRFYIRHYCSITWETVLYAIP